MNKEKLNQRFAESKDRMISEVLATVNRFLTTKNQIETDFAELNKPKVKKEEPKKKAQ